MCIAHYSENNMIVILVRETHLACWGGGAHRKLMYGTSGRQHFVSDNITSGFVYNYCMCTYWNDHLPFHIEVYANWDDNCLPAYDLQYQPAHDLQYQHSKTEQTIWSITTWPTFWHHSRIIRILVGIPCPKSCHFWYLVTVVAWNNYNFTK